MDSGVQSRRNPLFEVNLSGVSVIFSGLGRIKMRTHLLAIFVMTVCLLTVSSSAVAQNVTAGNAKNSGAMPPLSIPTFSTENLGRMSHFYVGGHYVGAPGKEQMDGAMYVEVWVPKQI